MLEGIIEGHDPGSHSRRSSTSRSNSFTLRLGLLLLFLAIAATASLGGSVGGCGLDDNISGWFRQNGGLRHKWNE